MIPNKRMTVIFIVSLFSSPMWAASPDGDCIDWLNSAKIFAGSKDCILRCSTQMTDMRTFLCPDQCDSLCKPKSEGSWSSRFTFYPGLTEAEKALVVKNPKQALMVYQQKRLAEDSTDRNFPDQNLNDESDAFRHFIWAGLLTKELGRQKAKEFLDAHETDPDQPEGESRMDSFNNGRGQSAAESLLQSKNWSLRSLEAEGLRALHAKELNVMKPRLRLPKEPK